MGEEAFRAMLSDKGTLADLKGVFAGADWKL
jgi:hypothetical protein